ncbi:MAG: nucleotide-binding protein [Oscillospiraceae bacterium]|nr:nucleotide-binding protein [Oscillospiraceae bacterium]
MRDKVFIGCSSESLPIARAIQAELDTYNQFDVIIWNQQAFSPSEYLIPELLKKLSNSNYAIFIFSDDDKVRSRGKQKNIVRDNTLFEFGLATGLLGLDHCFAFKTRSVVLPSDFGGLIVIDYNLSNSDLLSNQNSQAAVGPAVTKFYNSIKSRQVTADNIVVSWESYCECVKGICKKLAKSPRQGGFRFDAIVGITRGGVIAADLINRKFLARAPLFCLWPDYLSAQPDISFQSSINDYIYCALQEFGSILIVDDITRSGKTIVKATETLIKKYPEKNVKSAVIYVPDKYKNKVDYYGEIIVDNSISMPYSIFD